MTIEVTYIFAAFGVGFLGGALAIVPLWIREMNADKYNYDYMGYDELVQEKAPILTKWFQPKNSFVNKSGYVVHASK